MTIVDRLSGVTSGLGRKAPVRCATPSDTTLAGLQIIDGVQLAEGDRVLVKSQSAAAENGIYVASTGNWTRAADFDGAGDAVTGTAVLVAEGSGSSGREFYITNTGPILIGTTGITWVRFQPPAAEEVNDDAISTAKLQNSAVTNVKLAEMADATVKGRAAGSGAGVPVDLSPAQIKAIIGAIQNTDLSSVGTGTVKGRVAAGTGVLQDLTPDDLRTLLQISAFGASLILNANATAARTTLGISAFGSTLIDDLDANGARATLGLSTFESKSLVSDGYLKLQNGLIVQWGVSSIAAAGSAVSFPTAFPNACWSVVATPIGTSSHRSVSVATFTKTNFIAAVWNGATDLPFAASISWIALGA